MSLWPHFLAHPVLYVLLSTLAERRRFIVCHTGSSISSSVQGAGDGDEDDERSTASWLNATRDDVGAGRSKHEYRLLRDLLVDYEPAALPSLNESDAVRVKMGIALFQIRELVRLIRTTRLLHKAL